MADLKAMARRKKGPVRRLGTGETAEVRFLRPMDDPLGWRCLFSYYDEEKRRSFFYEEEDEVPAGRDSRESYFALAMDIESGEVEVWEIRKTMAGGLADFDDEYGGITDRNYRLKRRGEGLDTKYTSTPMDKSKFTKGMAKAKNKNSDKLVSVTDRLLSTDE